MATSRSSHAYAARSKPLLATFTCVALVVQLWASPALVGQTNSDGPVLEPYPDTDVDPDVLNAPWVDPIEQFQLEEEPLAAAPEFDFRSLHSTPTFEEGVEELPVRGTIDVTEETERHTRALQAVATAEQSHLATRQAISSAEAAIAETTKNISQARRETREIEAELTRSESLINELTNDDLAEIDEQSRLTSEIDSINDVMVEFAIRAFTGENDPLEVLLQDPGPVDQLELTVVTSEIREQQRADIDSLSTLIDESNARRNILADRIEVAETFSAARRTDIENLRVEIAELSTTRSTLRDEVTQLEAREELVEATIEDAVEFTEITATRYQLAYEERLELFVSGTDIPLVALNAYVRASRALATEDPACGIHWSQLAGIGKIESLHGYFGSSTLDVDGNTTEDIRGLALDGRILSGGGGTGSTPDPTGRTQETSGVKRLALIRDSDNGVLDGDQIFDRAVGPMQFIPSTWRLYDADGNDDGETDPQNVYDAALAAAHYLCDAPGSMQSHDGEQRAYFAYNLSLIHI